MAGEEPAPQDGWSPAPGASGGGGASGGAAGGAGSGGGRHVNASGPAGAAGGRLAARNVSRGTILATDVEVAGGLWAKFMGLMGRPSLAAGSALWLPDSNGIHMMFMRFPIDAVFLGKAETVSGERPVVAVRERLPAWRGLVPFVRGAHGVLELPAGAVAETGTAAGDRVRLE